MTLTEAVAWARAHSAEAAVLLGAVALVWKSLSAKSREAIEKSYPRAAGLVRLAVQLAPDLLGAARVGWYQVAQGQPRPGVAPPAAPPSQSITTTVRDVENGGSGLRGFAKLDALAWMLGAFALCFASAVLAGCPLPPPDGCTPRDTRCSPTGIPEVCSASQRWTHGATTPACTSWGASIACCLARTPYDGVRHACVPPVACLPETSAPDAGAESGAL